MVMMKKHTREENVVFFRGKRILYFSHACCRRIKSRRRRDKRNWSDFFALFRERQKREKDRIFFKTALHSFLHLLLISLVLLFLLWCLSATFRRPQTEKVSASVVAF